MSNPNTEPEEIKSIEAGIRLVKLRMKRSGEATEHLIREANKQSKYATVSRITVIVLGAVVGIRGIVENLMAEMGEVTTDVVVVMVFTIVGFVIAVVAALQQAFKFEEKAIGLSGIAQRSQSMTSNFMRLAEDPQNDTYSDYWELAKEQDEAYDALSKEALKYGVTLKTSIDFSKLLSE